MGCNGEVSIHKPLIRRAEDAQALRGCKDNDTRRGCASYAGSVRHAVVLHERLQVHATSRRPSALDAEIIDGIRHWRMMDSLVVTQTALDDLRRRKLRACSGRQVLQRLGVDHARLVA